MSHFHQIQRFSSKEKITQVFQKMIFESCGQLLNVTKEDKSYKALATASFTGVSSSVPARLATLLFSGLFLVATAKAEATMAAVAGPWRCVATKPAAATAPRALLVPWPTGRCRLNAGVRLKLTEAIGEGGHTTRGRPKNVEKGPCTGLSLASLAISVSGFIIDAGSMLRRKDY